MSSKVLNWLLLTTLFGFLGCTPKVGEEPPPRNLPALNATQCLSTAVKDLQKFIRGVATEREIVQSWDCFEKAFDLFQKYVQGSDRGRYRPQELADFLENNFFEKDPATQESDNISTALQGEMMKIKQIFFGGDRDFITRAELTQITQFLRKLQSYCLRLNPYMKVITGEWSLQSPEASQEELQFFEQANLAVQEVAKSFAKDIKDGHPPYQFNDFVSLITEVSYFYGETWSFIGTIHKYLPVIGKLKVAVAGGIETELRYREWNSFILLSARGYVQYLRYHYFIQKTQELPEAPRRALVLNYLSRTVEDSFSIFQDLVNAKPSQVISQAETSAILFSLSEVYTPFKVSQKFIDEIMRVKKVFLGGSVDNWTAEDFNSGRLQVYKLKELIERFLPYLPVYTSNWKPDLTNPDYRIHFMKSELGLVSALTELGTLLQADYSLDHLKSLIEEFENLYPPESLGLDGQDHQWTEALNKWTPVILSLKGLIFRDESVIFPQKDWGVLLNVASRSFMKYLEYEYFMNGHKFVSNPFLSSLLNLTESVITLLQDTLVRRGMGFTREELNRLLANLKAVGVIPSEIRQETLEGLVKSILQNLFMDPQMRLAGIHGNDFNLETLAIVRQELRTWLEPEIFVSELFTVSEQWSPTQVEVTSLIKNKLSDANLSSYLKTGLNELLMGLQTPFAVTTDPQGRMQISNRIPWTYNRESIFYANLSRTTARLLVRGYSLDMDRINKYKGFTRCEADLAFMDLRAPFIDLNLLDITSTFVGSRFLEANIFVPRSNGDTEVNFLEFTDLISMIFSGLINDAKLKEDLRKDCPITVDANKKEVVEFSCMRQSYYHRMGQEMTAVPEYFKFVASVSEKEWREAFVNQLKAAGWIPQGLANQDKEMVDLSSISLLPHIIQYIEMVVSKYDLNRDGWLSTSDVLKAYPIFEKVIYDLAKPYIDKGLINKEDLPALFTFLAKYGEVPGINNFAKWLWWKNTPNSWNIKAGRSQISKILGYIADQVAQAELEKEDGSVSSPSTPNLNQCPVSH